MIGLDIFLYVFDRRFGEYHELFREVNAKIVGYSETMPKISYDNIQEIRGIYFSLLYIKKRDISWVSAYILFMVATRQIMPNGNKRTAFFAMIFLLATNKLEINIEGLGGVKFINDLRLYIKKYEEADRKDKEIVKDECIKKLAKVIKLNIKPIEKN